MHRLPWKTILAAVVLAGCAGASAAPETGPTPAESGGTTMATAISFSAEQAERGEIDFGILCGECHGTTEFRGTNFQFRWRRQTAWDFFRTVSTTMPENAPGSLTNQEYADVIAYILTLNGHTAGDQEMPGTEAAMDQILVNPGNQ